MSTCAAPLEMVAIGRVPFVVLSCWVSSLAAINLFRSLAAVDTNLGLIPNREIDELHDRSGVEALRVHHLDFADDLLMIAFAHGGPLETRGITPRSKLLSPGATLRHRRYVAIGPKILEVRLLQR